MRWVQSIRSCSAFNSALSRAPSVHVSCSHGIVLRTSSDFEERSFIHEDEQKAFASQRINVCALAHEKATRLDSGNLSLIYVPSSSSIPGLCHEVVCHGQALAHRKILVGIAFMVVCKALGKELIIMRLETVEDVVGISRSSSGER